MSPWEADTTVFRPSGHTSTVCSTVCSTVFSGRFTRAYHPAESETGSEITVLGENLRHQTACKVAEASVQPLLKEAYRLDCDVPSVGR